MVAPRILNVERDGDLLIVILGNHIGSLHDADILDEFQGLAERLKESGVTRVVFDFAHVAYFGSSMLEGLRRIWTDLHADDGKMVVCNLSEVGRDILHVSKFDTLWPIVESRAEALESIKS